MKSRPARAADVVLDFYLLAHFTSLHARHAEADRLSLASDRLLRGIPAQHAHTALLAQETCHGRDGLGEHPLAALAGNLALLDGIEGVFAHDHDVRSRHELQLHRLDALSGLHHGFARVEEYRLCLHWSDFPVEAQPTERHAPLATRRASEGGEIITLLVSPALGVVDEIDEVLFHWV